jgi:hypothetical protein
MDNRINEIRSKIKILRAEMLDVEDSIRDQINRDLDCTDTSLRLMALRRELVTLLQHRKIAGDDDRCPTVEERLKENHRPQDKRNKSVRGVIVHRP